MAHADYDCCACCDRKMSYSPDATTKRELCTSCAVELAKLGVFVKSGQQVLEWIGATGVSALPLLAVSGYQKCYYPNPVDDAVAAIIAAAQAEDL